MDEGGGALPGLVVTAVVVGSTISDSLSPAAHKLQHMYLAHYNVL